MQLAINTEADLFNSIYLIEQAALDNLISQCSSWRIDALLRHYGYSVELIENPYMTGQVWAIVHGGAPASDDIFETESEAQAEAIKWITDECGPGEVTAVCLSLRK